MAKPLRGEREVKLGDETFTLRLALGNLEELEAQLGKGILAIASGFTNGQSGLRESRAIIRQGFAGAGIKVSEKRLGELIEGAGLNVIPEAATLLTSVIAGDEGNAGAAGQTETA